MSQSNLGSVIEASANIAIGAGVALLAQIIVFPWFGLHPTFTDNLQITAIFTLVSFVRSYFVRRLFNRLDIKGRFRPKLARITPE